MNEKAPDDYHNLKIGRLGEQIAGCYLKNKGYQIIKQNYKTKYAEIDLITRQKKFARQPILVFIEVRTKIGEKFGSPEETFTKRKMKKIKKNCQIYAQLKNWKKRCRIDAICIVLFPNKTLRRVTHYENIIF